MPSAVGVSFTLLSLAFAWLLWRSRRDAGGESDSTGWLRVRSAIPPALLIACLPSGCSNERFDTLRLTAQAMIVTEVAQQGGRRAATPAPGCEAYFRTGEVPVFVVGRARGCVDLIVQDPNGAPVDGALVRLDTAPGGAPSLRLASIANGTGAMIAAYDTQEGRVFAGAVPIAEGDRLCLTNCAAGDAGWWTFRDGALAPAGGGAARPLRVREGPFGSVEPYGPTERINRLSALLCTDIDSGGGCRTPALAGPATPGAAARPALSLLFQQGGWRGHQWMAMLLDPGAQLRKASGGGVRPQLTAALPVEAGAVRRVAILGLRDTSLRELRSFTIGHDFRREPIPRRTFRLALDTPELIPIGHCARPLSRLAVSPDQVSAEAFAIGAFGNRPNSVLASAAAGLPIDRYDLCRSTSFAFSAPLDRAVGDAAAGPVRRQIEFQVDRMGIAWLLVWLAAAVAIVVHVASERLWLRNRLDGQLLALVQYLLVLRAIIGIEGVFADPALDWRLIYGDVGVALVTLPAILIAVRRRDEVSLATLVWVAVFVAAALAGLWWWLGAPDWITQFLAALAFGALGLRALTLLLAPARPATSTPEGTPPGDTVTEPAPAPRRARMSFTRLILDRPPGFWPVVLAIIVAVRIGLGLLGFRERLFGIALSAIYVPLLLTCIAAVLAQAEAAADGQRSWFGLLFLVALGFGTAVVGLVINDVGFTLVHAPPIAGVALWRLARWRKAAQDDAPAPSWRERLPWIAPAAGLAVGYFALWAMIAVSPPPADDAPLDRRVAYAVDERSVDPNWLRLRAVFAPGQIDRIGNRNAAIQLDQSLLLHELTGTLLGRGWLTPVDLGTFRRQATHLSDYLSASHIMAPFGRAGAVALLLVLAAAAAAAVSGRLAVPAAWPQLAGALAIWTLFGAAAYMVLANLLLVPFTGRNIYLLAASSGGDLIEALGLLLMARLGLIYVRSGHGAAS